MKYRTTAKTIRNSGDRVIAAGYCEMYHLLYGEAASAYACGVYGWNFDVYHVDGVTICTGYRGMPGARLGFEKVREAEKRAEKIACDRDKPHDQKVAEIAEIRRALLGIA